MLTQLETLRKEHDLIVESLSSMTDYFDGIARALSQLNACIDIVRERARRDSMRLLKGDT